QAPAKSKAITDVDLLVLDDELLDILCTWDQAAAGTTSGIGHEVLNDPRLAGSAFSAEKLRSGVFAQLPAAHIDELLRRFERVKSDRGEIVIREGGEGDCYYVVESGRFEVERL